MSEGEKRLVQFELLRVVAMLGILMNHVFNYGLHIYDDFTLEVSSSGDFLLWSVLQLMKLMALPSVNCYILITGFFMVNNSKWRIKGIWKVWSTTCFYAVSIYLLAVATGLCPFQWDEMLNHATPLYHNNYWFVTSYIVLMILAPLLSWGLQRLSQRQYLLTLALGFIVCFQFLLGRFVMDGQQILLFVYLFMIGGYIRRYHEGPQNRLKWIVLISVLILMLMYGVAIFKNMNVEGHDYYIYAMEYHGLVLPLSVAIFLLFKNLTIKGMVLKKVIYALAPLCFSVYIIHTQSVVDKYLWQYATEMFADSPTFMIPLLVLLLCVSVFFICCAIDYLRVRIAGMLKKTLW